MDNPVNTNIIIPASRVNLVQEYYFSRKLKQVAEMRQKGLNVINLGIGSPDLPPSEPVIKALHTASLNPNNHGYQSYYGIPELRNAFSKWYKTWFNVDLNPSDEILPLIGSKEGIMHISMAFLNPGDEALIPNPGYPTYEAATKLAGGSVRYYDLTEEGRWLPDINKIEAAGVSGIKIMWINYPHMPTGRKASADIFLELVSFARRHKILIVNDNPYSFILNDDQLSILSINGAREVALELNSLSKSHNMAGWRIGMVGGKSDYISSIVKVKSNMDSGMFHPLQAAAAVALDAPMEWYNQLNELYRCRRTAAEDLMRATGCTFDSDQSGLFLWGKIPAGFSNGEELTEKLLNEAHVFITPGSVFGSNGENYVRISLCATEKAMREATARIRERIFTLKQK
jgi:aspartate/methionine/tyrosine aminotransferase